MEKIYIYGPTKIMGSVSISGSKNSILPILFASILTEKIVEIYNTPKIKDVELAVRLLCNFGVKVKYGDFIRIDASCINVPLYISKKLMKSIRASIWILAPLVARLGKGKVFFPGGCMIGNRPINLHIDGLRKLGALIEIRKNCIEITAKSKLYGSHIIMEKVSVGATITIMLAATLATGVTIIDNAALEPEVEDTANFLITLGAKIYGIGTKKIIINGVHKLYGGTYKIMPDRIETGTFLVAAAISKGKIICKSTNPNTLHTVLLKLEEAGADINIGNDWISLDMHGNRPKAVTVCTSPYPGFPTDMQAQFSLLNLIAEGKGIIIETIFENRFMHIPELIKMGGNVKIINNKIVCYGVQILFGKEVIATDLRSSACLILAGCIAQGTTIVNKTFHLDRGYDRFEEKLRNVGARIIRVKEIHT